MNIRNAKLFQRRTMQILQPKRCLRSYHCFLQTSTPLRRTWLCDVIFSCSLLCRKEKYPCQINICQIHTYSKSWKVAKFTLIPKVGKLEGSTENVKLTLVFGTSTFLACMNKLCNISVGFLVIMLQSFQDPQNIFQTFNFAFD